MGPDYPDAPPLPGTYQRPHLPPPPDSLGGRKTPTPVSRLPPPRGGLPRATPGYPGAQGGRLHLPGLSSQARPLPIFPEHQGLARKPPARPREYPDSVPEPLQPLLHPRFHRGQEPHKSHNQTRNQERLRSGRSRAYGPEINQGIYRLPPG